MARSSSGTYRPSDSDCRRRGRAVPGTGARPLDGHDAVDLQRRNPNGVWQLFVLDDASGDAGAVGGGWCLNVSTAAPTTTALTSSLNPSTFGQSVTFTATVTSGATVNAGTVTFKDGAATLAANVAVNASGVATFTTSTLDGRFTPHHRHYNGTPAFQTSTSTAVTQVVQRAPTRRRWSPR